MLPFLPPAGSVIQYTNPGPSKAISNYLVTGYTDETIAKLHNLDTGAESCIIMKTYSWPVWEKGVVISLNPYIALMD